MLLIVVAALVMSPPPRVSKTPLQRETAIWEKVKRDDSAGYGAMLAPTYVGVYTDGVFDKRGEVASVHNDHLTSVKLSDFKVHMLNKDDMLVTYSANVKGTSSGRDVSGRYWESSTWHRSGRGWLGTFHMEVKASR